MRPLYQFESASSEIKMLAPPDTTPPTHDTAVNPSTPVPMFKWPFLAAMVLVAVALIGLAAFLPSRSVKSQLIVPAEKKQAVTSQLPLKVHVVGEVKKPGLYEFQPNQRIDDAITRAGGATPNANLNAINLSAFLEDGKQIKVPSVLDTAITVHATSTKASTPPTPNDFVQNPLNLNTATHAQLESLPLIGSGTADKILTLRKRKGKFTSVSELEEIPGLGDRTLEKLRPLVTVG